MATARKRTWDRVEVRDHATGKTRATPVDAFGTVAVVVEVCDALAIEFFDGMRVLDGGESCRRAGSLFALWRELLHWGKVVSDGHGNVPTRLGIACRQRDVR